MCSLSWQCQLEQRLSETLIYLPDDLYNTYYHWINACYSPPRKGAAPTESPTAAPIGELRERGVSDDWMENWQNVIDLSELFAYINYCCLFCGCRQCAEM